MITRQEYINNCGGTDEESHTKFVTYYQQFITNTIETRLYAFLKRGRDINNLKHIDVMASSVPLDVMDLLKKAGDYPTLGNMVCIYKVAYELRNKA